MKTNRRTGDPDHEGAVRRYLDNEATRFLEERRCPETKEGIKKVMERMDAQHKCIAHLLQIIKDLDRHKYKDVSWIYKSLCDRRHKSTIKLT